uniref:protein SOSEKI 1 n=1 Tax=Erigeron canadensis TaxID=72917 RepID=UPI001CB8BADD|nr:protein SOSEKI 1 [Erigeron canadensis]
MIEAQVANNGVVSNNNGCQVRRVHIVYYLCHNGRIEHPHLIRIHHRSHNGVHLKDVKRWLSKLRGEDMPQKFAWSYKRKYKGGYIWQDILDEDLITPICDNEYVLKGSQISKTTSNNVNEDFEPKSSSPYEVITNDQKYPSTRKEYSLDFSTNTSTNIEESSFGSNVETEDTIKNQDEYKDEEVVQNLQDKNENNSLKERLLNKNANDYNENNNKNKKSGIRESVTSCFKVSPSPTTSFRKSNRASSMLRNWITCGTTSTHENAVVVNSKRHSSRIFSTVNCKENNTGRQLCKEQTFKEYEKSFDGESRFNKNKSKKEKDDSNNVKTFPAAHKPFNGPKCSQCGRQFNPEKLHSHMQYCRGMKAMARSASSRAKTKTSRPYSPSTTPSLHTLLLEK